MRRERKAPIGAVSLILKTNRGLSAAINGKLRDVGPRIMSGRIKVLTLSADKSWVQRRKIRHWRACRLDSREFLRQMGRHHGHRTAASTRTQTHNNCALLWLRRASNQPYFDRYPAIPSHAGLRLDRKAPP